MSMTNKELIEKIEKEVGEYDLNHLAQFGSASGSYMKQIVLDYLKGLKKDIKKSK